MLEIHKIFHSCAANTLLGLRRSKVERVPSRNGF